jgi:hypothetical protein
VPGMKRRPVPAPVTAIVKAMVVGWPWWSAQARTDMPVASVIEPRNNGRKVCRG